MKRFENCDGLTINAVIKQGTYNVSIADKAKVAEFGDYKFNTLGITFENEVETIDYLTGQTTNKKVKQSTIVIVSQTDRDILDDLPNGAKVSMFIDAPLNKRDGKQDVYRNEVSNITPLNQ